jgi:hypothetical protein
MKEDSSHEKNDEGKELEKQLEKIKIDEEHEKKKPGAKRMKKH